MDYESKMSELFEHEDAARKVAHQLIEMSKRDPAAAAREKPGLLAFLRGPMARHIDHEERSIFPLLVGHGLGPEVDIACRHHADLRRAMIDLDAAVAQDKVVAAVVAIARLMLHHTNFEGDFIYPALTRQQWHELMAETEKAPAAPAKTPAA